VTSSINIGGSANIHIAAGASLTIYMAGATTTIAGNGLVNDTHQAKSFAYYGLPANTTINITGNGAFYGTVYAPQADFYLGSGGSSAHDFTGASITKTTTLSGHFNFHYDENLARTGPFR
jgi:choice-of-anchor A domain-containing protein